MNRFAKSALMLGAVGAIALGSVTASEARGGHWVAGAAGLAVGAAVGTAADAAYYSEYNDGPVYAQPVQYAPGSAYTGDPAYRYGYRGNGYAPGYGAYAYAPGYGAYAYAPGYRRYYRGHVETRSTPHHFDPGAGYNSNTVAPWQDWKYQGHDY
jgi:hypothetical protein